MSANDTKGTIKVKRSEKQSQTILKLLPVS